MDTGPLHARAEQAALAALGIPELAGDHPKTFGHGIMRGMQMLAEHYGLPSGQHVFDAYLPAWEALFAEGIAAKPGADDVLRQLHAMTVPLALVTSGEREYVDKVLARFGWHSLFKHTVTLESVHNLKPDPEPYLMAANLLELDPKFCAGFEDSASGLASVHAAEMFSVYVGESIAPAGLVPDMALASLVHLSGDELSRLFAQ